MKFLFKYPLFITLSFFLTACTAHTGSGVWQSIAKNEQGISKLIVDFNGKAEFSSDKPQNTDWHCFWSTVTKKKISLECTPSINVKQKKTFELSINKKGQAQLRQASALLATFVRLDEQPLLKK